MAAGSWFRRLIRGSDTERAREYITKQQEALKSYASPQRRQFLKEAVTARAPPNDRVLFGSLAENPDKSFVSMPSKSLQAVHGWVTGSTGSGKSVGVLSWLRQLLPKPGFPSIVIALDMKGELTMWLRELILPLHACTLPPAQRERFLNRIVVVDPFDENFVPELNLLYPDSKMVPEEQCMDVALSINEMLGRDNIGPIMSFVIKNSLLVAMEANLSLPQVRDLLSDDRVRYAIAERVSPPLRNFLLNLLERQKSAIASVLIRLDSLLTIPSIHQCLSAPKCLDFYDWLSSEESSVIVIDLGSNLTPSSASLVRLFGNVLFGRLARAALFRGTKNPPVFAFIDECQSLLRTDQVEWTEDLITKSRHKNFSWWLIHQSAAQIESVSANLLKIIKNCVTLEAHFRTSYEDASRLSHILPITGQRRRELKPWENPADYKPFLDRNEELKALIETTSTLPQRHFWWQMRNHPYGAQLLKSQFVDFDRMKKAVTSVPAEIRERCYRGVVSIPVGELKKHSEERDKWLRSLIDNRTIRPANTPGRPRRPKTSQGPRKNDVKERQPKPPSRPAPTGGEPAKPDGPSGSSGPVPEIG